MLKCKEGYRWVVVPRVYTQMRKSNVQSQIVVEAIPVYYAECEKQY